MLELAKTYDVCLEGEPKLTVIFLHGIAADSSSFDGLLSHLLKDDSLKSVRFLAFDWLGAGKSFSSDELEYNFKEQLEALQNSIVKANVKSPVVIVAHSMGTMLATRFSKEYSDLVKGLVLVSAPVYREEDIKNPMFEKALEGFREVVGRKSKASLNTKAFESEIKNIVSDIHNYDYLAEVKLPTIIIYGELDKIIAPFNLPALLKANPNITAIKTPGSHSVTIDKFGKISTAIKKLLKEEA